jgi:uncharacterized protein
MKVILQDQRRYVLRFDKGEEVIAGLLAFAGENSITAASFQGIGACSEVELGYYYTESKSYGKKHVAEDLEIVSLAGNIGVLAGQPILHAHGSFGRQDFTMLGGHVFKVTASATCEIFIIKLQGELVRERNERLNLNLLA